VRQAVFSNIIALGVLKGGSLKDCLLLSNADYALVIVVWYLCNHSITLPIVGDIGNLWKKVTESPAGGGVQKVLDLASVVVITKLTIEAAAPCADGPDFQFKSLVKAVLVATASTAIPSVEGNADVDTVSAGAKRALLIGLLVMTDGLQKLPDPLPNPVFDLTLGLGLTQAILLVRAPPRAHFGPGSLILRLRHLD
jgi:hypothetical protein